MRFTMKKTLFTLLLIAFTTTAWAQKHLTILHTNDTHSCIYPLSPNLSDTATAGRGGFLRRIAMLKEERAKDPELLLFDSGDFSQGSPYYTLFKGDVEAGLMNEMHYDAGTIGNHEFDYGLENMARVFRLLNFPILCSNYDFKDTPLKDIVKPYTIIKRKGVKIGVFALCPKMAGLVVKENYEPLQYLDPIEVAKKMVATLQAQHCDMIICLSHLGWQIEGDDDVKLISATRGIDLVLGGHSHSLLKNLEYVNNLDGKAIPVDQNGKNAIWIGKLSLTLDKK